jgi:hypothetical protein
MWVSVCGVCVCVVHSGSGSYYEALISEHRAELAVDATTDSRDAPTTIWNVSSHHLPSDIIAAARFLA